MSLARALEEIQFGPDRTLNLRDSLPSAADARFRAESWLRQRQTRSSEDVLIVTGRGKGSPNGIPVVKQEVLALLFILRRQGVVKSWREHAQGAIVVEPASMSELLSAPRRHRDAKKAQSANLLKSQSPAQLVGLAPETVRLLRQLAENTLVDLGVQDGEDLTESEMARHLSVLVRALPEGSDRETALCAVIIRAIEELNAQKHG